MPEKDFSFNSRGKLLILGHGCKNDSLAASRGTLDGSLSFPEVVGKLLAAEF